MSVPPKNLAVFTRQLSVMIDAGLPLVQCLEILGRQETHAGFAATIRTVRRDVEAGAALATAMKKHPGVFDALYSSLIAAGEAGGILDTILKRLAVYIEQNVKLRRDVRSALVYPVAVLVVAIVVVAAILWKVIPTFADLFEGLGAAAPLGNTRGDRRKRRHRRLWLAHRGRGSDRGLIRKAVLRLARRAATQSIGCCWWHRSSARCCAK